MVLAQAGRRPDVNLEVAAAGNTEVVRAKRKTMKALESQGSIEDMLITLGRQYHLIRPLKSNDALFFYLVLDKSRARTSRWRATLLPKVEKEVAI